MSHFLVKTLRNHGFLRGFDTESIVTTRVLRVRDAPYSLGEPRSAHSAIRVKDHHCVVRRTERRWEFPDPGKRPELARRAIVKEHP